MRLHADSRTLMLLAAAVAGIASRAGAAPITVPAGLAPGDTYRLVFVTSTSRDATSSNINDYNAFVSSVAASVPELLALGATWTAIGTTASVNAIDNIGFSPSDVGIYRLDGAKIADGTGGLFSGSILVPIAFNELGADLSPCCVVWSGSSPFGIRYSDVDVVLGSLTDNTGPPPELPVPYAIVGVSTLSNGQWLSSMAYPTFMGESFYGISSEITVGEAVPEPGSIVLAALGGAILLFAKRRKQQNP